LKTPEEKIYILLTVVLRHAK